jgi:hypothetical protein
MERLLLFAVVVALSLVASGVLLAQSNTDVGTWKLNVAKSKFSNAPAPKSQTRTVVAQGDGAKVTVEGVAGDGSRIAYSYTTNYDGKGSAISGVGLPNGADTVALKRVDANTVTYTFKNAGKVPQTARSVVSKDGKVTTLTAKGSDAQGHPISVTVVYDKQ